jgi:hypothetical protein
VRFQEILEACWTGYRQAGMKKKGNRQVPNCVPVEEVKTGPEITGKDLLFKAAAMAMRDASREGVSLDYEQAIRQASKIYGIPYQPSELPKLLAQRAEIDRQLALLKQGKQVAKQRRQAKLAPTPAGAEEYWKTHALPTDRIKPPTRTLEAIEEDLRKWFKEKWVRFGPDGKIRGDCARGSSSEGKPKCLPQSKAHALGKKGRASAAAKKRREDPNPERRGPAKNVATKVKEADWNDEDDWYDEEETNLQSGDYVRDRQDGEYGEVFRMQGDPSERRVRILDRDGKGWYISPERLVAVDRHDPDIQRYFGKRRHRDMDEGWKQNVAAGVLGTTMALGAEPAKAEFANITPAQLQQSLKRAELADKYAEILIQRAKDEGRPIDPRMMDAIKVKASEMAQRQLQKQKVDEKQDACYRKVKSRYKVWPSAYASGALVQCRKKGAANWGTGGKKK